MNANNEMLRKAIESYGMDATSLTILKELPGNAHGDLHFKIQLDEEYYSARLLGLKRYDHHVFEELTNDMLLEQMKFCDFLNAKGIPFMSRKPAADGREFIHFTWQGSTYRFLLFKWLDGKHITHCTEDMAYKVGKYVRHYHRVSGTYTASFSKVSHLEGYRKFITMVDACMASTLMSSESRSLVSSYLNTASHHISQSTAQSHDWIVQSDLNPLNILWDEEENITGIVDFEHIGYTDRIEGIAWLVKWYSRTQGIDSDEVSPQVARSLLNGYGAEDFLNTQELSRLQSLVWLTGCMNWGFVKKTFDILKEMNGRNQQELIWHLAVYEQRGKKLLSLVE